MDTRPIRTHSLIPPLLIGIISLLGICLVLVATFLPKESAEPAPSRTFTPFKYEFLATETVIQTPTLETAETAESSFAPTFDIETSDPETTPSLLETEQNGTSPAGFSVPAATATPNPIFDNFEPLAAGTYDDTDYGFTYIGVWDLEENLDAYLETVLVSETVGDYVAFSFTGFQMGLGYQSSEDAGEITINIDGTEMTITQQEGDLWSSDEFESGTHYVLITHTGEGPINLDFIEILD